MTVTERWGAWSQQKEGNAPGTKGDSQRKVERKGESTGPNMDNVASLLFVARAKQEPNYRLDSPLGLCANGHHRPRAMQGPRIHTLNQSETDQAFDPFALYP